jgi:hypothetical protein
LATDGAILHVRLPASACIVDIEIDVLAAIGTAEWNQFRHVQMMPR